MIWEKRCLWILHDGLNQNEVRYANWEKHFLDWNNHQANRLAGWDMKWESTSFSKLWQITLCSTKENVMKSPYLLFMLMASSNTCEIEKLHSYLAKGIQEKDLGVLKYLLGIVVSRSKHEFFFSNRSESWPVYLSWLGPNKQADLSENNGKVNLSNPH